MGENIIEFDKSRAAEIKAIQDYEVGLIKPHNFNAKDPNNDMKKIDESFEKTCSVLEDLGVQNPHKLPVFKFFAKINYFKAKKAIK